MLIQVTKAAKYHEIAKRLIAEILIAQMVDTEAIRLSAVLAAEADRGELLTLLPEPGIRRHIEPVFPGVVTGPVWH